MPMMYLFVYIPFYTKKSFLKVLILIKNSQIPPTILTIIKKKVSILIKTIIQTPKQRLLL